MPFPPFSFPMNPIRSILSNTSQVAQDASCILRDTHPLLFPFALAAFGGITLAAFGTFVLGETGGAILSEIRRRHRLAVPHPASPSLRGTPTDADIAADCGEKPRTLHVRLRLGSRLADLEPTLDAAPHCTVSATGARRFASRGPGLKGWLADHRITVGYSSLVKYRLLALRLRQLLDLDARLPLEWLLPGESPDRPIPSALRTPYYTARRRLAKLLREHPNFSRLRRHVDSALGIPRLLTIRRTARRTRQSARDRRRLTEKKPVHRESVVIGDRCVLLDESIAESTKREFILFLQSPDLPPRLDALRSRAIAWIQSRGGGVFPPPP